MFQFVVLVTTHTYSTSTYVNRHSLLKLLLLSRAHNIDINDAIATSPFRYIAVTQ